MSNTVAAVGGVVCGGWGCALLHEQMRSCMDWGTATSAHLLCYSDEFLITYSGECMITSFGCFGRRWCGSAAAAAAAAFVFVDRLYHVPVNPSSPFALAAVQQIGMGGGLALGVSQFPGVPSRSPSPCSSRSAAQGKEGPGSRCEPVPWEIVTAAAAAAAAAAADLCVWVGDGGGRRRRVSTWPTRKVAAERSKA